jgi:hypothetical protein
MGVYDLGNNAYSTKRGSFSTSSTTYVTALSLAGNGTLRSVSWTGIVSTTINVRITIDGVVYGTYQSTSNQATYSCLLDGSSLGSTVTDISLKFKTSCLVEINTSVNTPSLNFVYDN